MFRPKTLLKVMSIIFIIMGVFGLIGTVFSYAMIPKLTSGIEGVDTSMLEAALTPLNLALSVVSCIACIGAGIAGVSGKSKKWATIFIGLYTILTVVSIVQSIVMGTFTFLVVLDVILPLLYWWGLYQSDTV